MPHIVSHKHNVFTTCSFVGLVNLSLAYDLNISFNIIIGFPFILGHFSALSIKTLWLLTSFYLTHLHKTHDDGLSSEPFNNSQILEMICPAALILEPMKMLSHYVGWGTRDENVVQFHTKWVNGLPYFFGPPSSTHLLRHWLKCYSENKSLAYYMLCYCW